MHVIYSITDGGGMQCERVFGGFLRSNRDLGVFTRATSGYVYPFLCDSFKVVVNVVLKEQF